MNNFEELLKNTKNLIQENERLEEERKEKRMELVTIMRNNFKSIYQTEVKQMTDIITDVASLVKSVKDKNEERISYSKDVMDGDKVIGCIQAEVLYDYHLEKPFYLSVALKGSDGGYNSENSIEFYLNEDNCISYYPNCKNYKSVFLTEDNTVKVVEEIRNICCHILEDYIAILESRNEGLGRDLEILKEQLGQSTCVQDKEDGTVEFHIGGKTYIGTVKEE